MTALLMLVGIALGAVAIVALIGWVAGTNKSPFREPDEPVEVVLPRRVVKVVVTAEAEVSQEPQAERLPEEHPDGGADSDPPAAVVIPLDRRRR